jgi:hypothetical protein
MSWPHDAAATEVNPTPQAIFSDEEYLQVVILSHPRTPYALIHRLSAAQIIIFGEVHSDLDGTYSNPIYEYFD